MNIGIKPIFNKVMKIKKVLTSLAIAGMVAISMVTPAMAEGSNIVVNRNGNALVGTLSAYRLMDAEISLKAGCDGGDATHTHTDDCYVYEYSITNETYRTALKTAIGEVGLSLDVNGDSVLSDEEIIDGLSKEGALTAAQTRTLADSLTESLKSEPATATSTTGSFTGLDKGYYLILETEKNGSATDSKSLAILNTAGTGDTLTINAKDGVPQLEKKILIADATEADGYKRVDVTDVFSGDNVMFELAITMPENIAELGNKFTMTVHDTADNLTMVGTPTYYVDGEEVTKSADTPATDDCFLESVITQNSFTKEEAAVTLTADSKVTIRYTAKLTDGSFSTAKAGNANEAWVEFPDDPYGDTTGTTVPDKVTVHTFQATINKIDAVGEALEGAEFTLSAWNEDDGDYTKTIAVNATSSTTTAFNFTGLDVGKYKLVETKTPDGYNTADPIEFEIRAEYDSDGNTTSLEVYMNDVNVSDESETAKFQASADTGLLSTSVVNTIGLRLPSTGGMGTYALYIGGALLIVAGGIALVITNRKNAKKESK